MPLQGSIAAAQYVKELNYFGSLERRRDLGKRCRFHKQRHPVAAELLIRGSERADQKREDARCIELTQTFVVEREPLHQLDDHDTERVPLEEKVAQSLPKCRGAHAACQLRCDAARRAMRQLTREPVHRTKTNACRCVLVDYAGDVSFRWVRHGARKSFRIRAFTKLAVSDNQ